MKFLANIGLWLVQKFGNHRAIILPGHVDAPAADTHRAWELGCTCRPCKVIGERRPLFYELASDCPIHYLPLVEVVYIRLGSPLSPPSANWTDDLRSSGLLNTKEAV